MCGIAGIYASKNNNDINHFAATIQAVLNQQWYRGPDYQQIEKIISKDNLVVLGHNRLSIIDLSNHANQPMWDETQRFCLVYNGMIYNYLEIRKQLQQAGYHFFSDSDTEVVLKAFMHWREDAFQYFNGMFALAIYDNQTQELWLVRDRFGVKPLFYTIQNDQIYFASTSEALAKQCKLQPNFKLLAKGLQYWCFDDNQNSVYENLFQVAPAEIIKIRFEPTINLIKKNFYCLKTQVNNLVNTFAVKKIEELLPQVLYTLEDAVKLRLRSDVPMGISLSGGIDSGLITSIASKYTENLSAFSFGSLAMKHSEAENAALIANNLRLNLHFVSPTAIQMHDAFWQTLQLQDAPFPNFSIVAQYMVFHTAHQRGIKVMLGGQGGDEVFMGYKKYSLFLLKHLLHQKQYPSALILLANLMPIFVGEMSQLKQNLFNFRRYTNTTVNSRWYTYANKLDLGASFTQPLWHRQYQDIYQFSLPMLLRYEDRNSMGNSIESRLPFLDYRLVELGLALPVLFKLKNGYNKWILRQIAKPLLPATIVNSKTKRGFDVGTQNWIATGIGQGIRDRILANQKMMTTMGLTKVDKVFSDIQLMQNPAILTEGIILTWLASKTYFNW